MQLKSFFIQLLLLVSFTTLSQKVKELTYPKNYFMFPIRPGQINHLSGGLGDLRANHFHGGLDIKTEQREGLPVYAAAAGYVSEIRVLTGGYGNVIFIKHPNGLTTVYGHLKSFEQPIYDYIIAKRQAQKGWEISVKPEANELPIRKGQIIALSGNTGGSGGPHLHFEIRNEQNNLLNPLYFSFSEIVDNLPPNLNSLIINPLNIQSRINGAFEKAYFYPVKKGNQYSITQPVVAKGEIGLELLAFDKMNFNQNNYGISCIEVLVNGIESFYYHLERIPVEDSRDINVHMNYGLEKTIGKKYQRLYLTDGNDYLPIYKPDRKSGKIRVEPGKLYNIQVKTWDSFENLSKLEFQIFGDTTTNSLLFPLNKLEESSTYQINENTLIINLENCASAETVCNLGVNGKVVPVQIAYQKGKKAVFLYDLRQGMPDFYEINDIQQELSFKSRVPFRQNYHVKAPNYEIQFNKNSLYDTLYLNVSKSGNFYKIGQPTIPLHDYINVGLKTQNISNKDKTSAYYIYGNKERFLGANWQGDFIKFNTRDLGDFTLYSDITAPTIKPIVLNQNRLAFRINDELSGIKEFRVEVDGKFILMDYDYKKALIWSTLSDSTVNYFGKIEAYVTDNEDNKAVFEYELNEETYLPKIVKKSKKNTTKRSSKASKTSKKKTKKRKK